jgi:DNA-binding NtrC family response regulator
VDTKRFLLALDGDDSTLRAVAETAAPYYQAHVTRDPRKFLAWLENVEHLGAVVTEHVLRTSTGLALLEATRKLRPHARRVLMTTYHDLASIVAGLHSGAIQHLVQKPFTPADLLAAILPEGVAAAAADEQRERRASA